MKSSLPSLRETWEKRPLSRKSVRSWCHCHHEYDKAFLFAAHGSMGIGGSNEKFLA